MMHDQVFVDGFADRVRSQNPRRLVLSQLQQDHQRQQAALEPTRDDVRKTPWVSRSSLAAAPERSLRPVLQWSRSHGEA